MFLLTNPLFQQSMLSLVSSLLRIGLRRLRLMKLTLSLKPHVSAYDTLTASAWRFPLLLDSSGQPSMEVLHNEARYTANSIASYCRSLHLILLSLLICFRIFFEAFISFFKLSNSRQNASSLDKEIRVISHVISLLHFLVLI